MSSNYGQNVTVNNKNGSSEAASNDKRGRDPAEIKHTTAVKPQIVQAGSHSRVAERKKEVIDKCSTAQREIASGAVAIKILKAARPLSVLPEDK